MYSQVSDDCWGGCGQLHIWWTCPTLRGFWDKLIKLVEKISVVQIPVEPSLVLLSIDLHLWPGDSRVVTAHIFIAARAAIASQLRKQSPPVFSKVLTRLNEQATYERMFAIQQLQWHKRQTEWPCWLPHPFCQVPH